MISYFLAFLPPDSDITIVASKMYFQNTLKFMTLHTVRNDSPLGNFNASQCQCLSNKGEKNKPKHYTGVFARG